MSMRSKQRRILRCLAWGAVSAASAPLLAGNSYTGATGLFYVPTAEVTALGELSFQQNNDQYFLPNGNYQQSLSPDWLFSGKGDTLNGTFNFSIGLFPRFEIGGRLSSFDLRDGSTGPSVRDLSGNAKWQFLQLGPCSSAIGMLDFAGEAKHFSGRYLSNTCSANFAGRWTGTLAYVDTDRSNTRPQGLVGGFTYNPIEQLQLLTEYEGSGWNTGLKINSGALFGRIKLAAIAKLHSTVNGSDTSLGVELALPLGMDHQRYTAPHSLPELAQSAPSQNSVAANSVGGIRTEAAPTQPNSFKALGLSNALSKAGFGEVQIERGRNLKHLNISYRDERYRASHLDGLGVALGTIAVYLQGLDINSVRVLVKQQDVEQLLVQFSPTEYVDFLNAKAKLPLKVKYAKHSDALESRKSARKAKIQLTLKPEIVNFVGTEKGVHDYSLAALANVTLPLTGTFKLVADYRLAAAHTDDFDVGGEFHPFRQESGLANAYLEWGYKPFRQLTVVGNGGYYRDIDTMEPFATFEAAFSSPAGRHQLALASSYRSTAGSAGEGSRDSSALGTYSYYSAWANMRISLEGGQFSASQRGAGLAVDRYFGDTIVRLFIRGTDSANLVGGIGFNLPFGPRQRWQPNAFGLQLGLADRFRYGVQTTINRKDGSNRLKPRFLSKPPLPFNMQENYLDYQRITPAALLNEAERLRAAYFKFGL